MGLHSTGDREQIRSAGTPPAIAGQHPAVQHGEWPENAEIPFHCPVAGTTRTRQGLPRHHLLHCVSPAIYRGVARVTGPTVEDVNPVGSGMESGAGHGLSTKTSFSPPKSPHRPSPEFPRRSGADGRRIRGAGGKRDLRCGRPSPRIGREKAAPPSGPMTAASRGDRPTAVTALTVGRASAFLLADFTLHPTPVASTGRHRRGRAEEHHRTLVGAVHEKCPAGGAAERAPVVVRAVTVRGRDR